MATTDKKVPDSPAAGLVTSDPNVLAAHGIVAPTGNKGAGVDTSVTPLPKSWGGTGIPSSGGGGSPSGGSSSGKSGSYDMSAYLKKQFAAQVESELAQLKGAYENALLGYDAAEEKLPATYQQAKNAAAVQNAQEKRAFDERAAANGLNSGTNGQAQLALSSMYQSQLAGLDRERAQQLSDIQLEKAKLQKEYEAAIAQARAEGDASLATALYQELVRVQGLEREDQQIADANKREDDLLQKQWNRQDLLLKSENEREDLLLKNKNDREDALLDREEANAEAEYARQLALAYNLIDPAHIGQINSLADLAALSAGTAALAGNPVATPPGGGGGYNNGNLTAEQVKALQRYFGVAIDGMWGPGSAAAAGEKTAEEAWAEYVNRPEGVPLGALSASLISGAGDQVIVEQAKKFVEAYPAIAWNSRTVDYMLADSGLTPAERALFKGYLKEYAPTWGTNAK